MVLWTITAREVLVMDEEYKEVYFHEYCETCKYEELDEELDPCNECLEHGMNIQTNKPVNWVEKK